MSLCGAFQPHPFYDIANLIFFLVFQALVPVLWSALGKE